jgi:hypothetical protein
MVAVVVQAAFAQAQVSALQPELNTLSPLVLAARLLGHSEQEVQQGQILHLAQLLQPEEVAADHIRSHQAQE